MTTLTDCPKCRKPFVATQLLHEDRRELPNHTGPSAGRVIRYLLNVCGDCDYQWQTRTIGWTEQRAASKSSPKTNPKPFSLTPAKQKSAR